jgi:hypothetical protein
MSFAQTIVRWLGSDSFYFVGVLCCVALAFKLYFKAFNSRVLVSLVSRRLKAVLKPSGSGSGIASPVGTTTVPYSENQKAL